MVTAKYHRGTQPILYSDNVWPTNKQLSKDGILKPSRVACLNTIGFQVTVSTAMLEAYCKIKQRKNNSKLEGCHTSNSHCNVPWMYPANPALEQLATNKRTALKNCTLKPSWVARLKTIYFQGVVSTIMPEACCEIKEATIKVRWRRITQTMVTVIYHVGTQPILCLDNIWPINTRLSKMAP